MSATVLSCFYFSFSWHADTLGADFSISPLEGYLAPAMEASFDITFHPKDVNQDVRKDQVPCRLWIVEKKKEGKSEKEVITQCNPLHITLTGMAIGQQQIKEHVYIYMYLSIYLSIYL